MPRMTITLPDDLAARLSVLPEGERAAFAVAAVARAAASLAARSDGAALLNGHDDYEAEQAELAALVGPLTQDDLDAIGRGLADSDAGRVSDGDAVLAELFGSLGLPAPPPLNTRARREHRPA